MPLRDFKLCLHYIFTAAQISYMRHTDIGNYRDIRTNGRGKAAHFAEIAHAHFHHRALQTVFKAESVSGTPIFVIKNCRPFSWREAFGTGRNKSFLLCLFCPSLPVIPITGMSNSCLYAPASAKSAFSGIGNIHYVFTGDRRHFSAYQRAVAVFQDSRLQNRLRQNVLLFKAINRPPFFVRLSVVNRSDGMFRIAAYHLTRHRGANHTY